MTETFALTTGRWFNKLKDDGRYAKAPAYRPGFVYTGFTYGRDYPEDFVPDAPLQVSVLCSPTTMALAIDVDHAEQLSGSATGGLVGLAQAFSVRDANFHVLVDMRGVAPSDWPQQGRTAWGDIKANGFIPMPGSVHYSGALYESTGNGPVGSTAELMDALKADRLAYAQARLEQAAASGNPRAMGVRTGDGAYVYASAYVAGSWSQLPDGFLTHDDELKDLAWDMGMRGCDEAVVFNEWHRLAGSDDARAPWTDRDFARHWRRVPAAYAEVKARRDAEDVLGFFGLDDAAKDAFARRFDAPDDDEPYTDVPPSLPAPGVNLAEQCQAWLGMHEFLPRGDTDSADADDTLSRNYPMSRYSPAEDVWLRRDTDRWRVTPTDQSDGLVENLMPLMDPNRRGRSLKDLVAEGADPDNLTDDQRERILAHEKRKKFGNSGSSAGIARKIRAKLKSPYPNPYWTDPADLDREPYELWAGGVTWDLHASVEALVQREPSNFVHLQTAAYRPLYDPGMWNKNAAPDDTRAPLFTALTRVVWPSDDELNWALNMLAMGFTGSPRKVLPVLQGERDSGKTTSVQMMIDVLGTYGGVINRKLLDGDTNSHDTVIMDLMGLRLAYLDEGMKSGKIARDRLKNVAGGGDLIGHRMRKDSVRFKATHTLVMSANPDEEPPLDDEAIRSRVRWIPCYGRPSEVVAAARKLDYFTSPAWKAEAPYVLGHMIVRCARVLSDESVLDKGNAPWSVTAAEQSVAEAQDDVLTWFKEATEPEPHGYPAEQLYINFRDRFVRLNGPRVPVPSMTKWGRRMNQLIPEDAPPVGPDSPDTRLRSAGNCNLRRARPRRETVFGLQPPEETNRPVNHPAPRTSGFTGSSDSADSTDTTHSRIYTRTHTHINSGDTAGYSQPPRHPGPSGTAGSPQPAKPQPTPVSSLSVEPAIPPHQDSRAVVFDLETGDGDALFTYEPHDETGFVRLAGLGEPGGAAHILTADDLIRELSTSAHPIAGHNILGFDLLALAWHHGADYDKLAAKAVDTEILARQADPPRSRESGSSEDRYSLDAIAERLGVGGKTDDINRLKRKYKGYDRIPLDDPEYRSYLEGDLAASAAVLQRLPTDAYTAREHVLATLAGRMTLNGFKVDTELLRQRYDEGQQVKHDALMLLHDGWGLPVDKTVLKGRGKDRHEVTEPLGNPLAADSGRAWLEGIWERYGLVDPPRTGKAGKLATGADDLKAIADNPRCPADLKAVIKLIGIVVGTRTVYQTAMDYLAADGRVHPRISFRQASGRWSVTQPGLTVFGKRDGRSRERDIFLPDDGHVLVSFDLAQVDMRSMAGHCQDPAYMAIFQDRERDAHTEIGALVGLSRQDAKKIGHGWNYGLGRNRMIRDGLDPAKVDTFIAGMEARFPGLIAWRETIREMGKRGEILDNGFGRKMRCDEARAYTVAPALMGQGGARDLMCESLLRLPRELWPYLRVMVHDEIVCSIPKDIVADVAQTVMKAFSWTWRDVPIYPDMSAGLTWGEASAK